MRAVLGFDPGLPVERASTPPAAWYVDPAVHAIERERVFRRTWSYACRAAQVERPGAFVAGRSAGLPWVVVRGEDGELRALANTCRHKATEVCAGAGVATHLTCPYHGWTYRLDGSLRSAPRMAGVEDFDRGEASLPRLGVARMGPLVLVHADPAADPPPAGPADELARTGWDELEFHERRVYEVACNWKVFCDNYLDGGLHVEHLHPGLAGQLDLDTYRTELFDGWSRQSCAPTALRDRTQGGAAYVFVYPNLMINRYGPCLDVNVVEPVEPGRCRVTFDFWFERGTDEAWRRASVEDSERTQREDVDVSERVQVGLASGTWARGRYAPRVEHAIHHFHRRLAADLG